MDRGGEGDVEKWLSSAHGIAVYAALTRAREAIQAMDQTFTAPPNSVPKARLDAVLCLRGKAM